MLPGIGRCGAGLSQFPTACWWLTHPAAITGVSVSARRDSPGGCGGPSVPLLCNRRVQSPCANLLQVRWQVTVSRSQPKYGGLFMSCQTVDLVSTYDDDVQIMCKYLRRLSRTACPIPLGTKGQLCCSV